MMYSSQAGSSLPRLQHAHHHNQGTLPPIDTNTYNQRSHSPSHSHEYDDDDEENEYEYESVTMAILSPDSDRQSDDDSDEQEHVSLNDNNNSHPSLSQSVDTQAIAGPSQFSRINAIAKLKRAASQREMRGRGDVRQPPQEEGSIEIRGEGGAAMDMQNGSQILSRDDESHSVSPAPPNMLRVEQLRSESVSPMRGLRDGASTPSSQEGSLLQRSRSQRGDARSPLPSLEQLRARILQERATAGLARSASTSAASAAARQYALEKLLGESPRQGAISPVSDTADDQEETTSTSGNHHLAVPGNQDQRPLLRRSRTIGGLTAAADAQRKAAFVQELDSGVPEDVKSGRRSSRRFAKAPLGSSSGMRSSVLNKPSEEKIEETKAEESISLPASNLDRSQSQRHIARTEMMRKLSTRRQGPKASTSPAPSPLLTPLKIANDEDEPQEKLQDVSLSPERQPALTIPFGQHSPVTPPPISLGAHLAPHISPDTSMLTVPGSSPLRYSPSSRPSTAMTSYHEADRNRASEMARLIGEEAFEYEKLLDLGYSTDDAYERVASARSGSYMSKNVSPRSVQEEAFSQIPAEEVLDSPPSKDQDVMARSSSPTSQANQSSQSSEMPMLSTEASIPLALGSRRESLEEVSADSNGERYELLDGIDQLPMPRRRPAWPESVTSVATSTDPFSSPQRTISTNRDSDDSKRSSKKSGKAANSKIHPTMNLSSSNTIQRFEDILTPTFVRDFGDILDYSDSPIMAKFPAIESPQSNKERLSKESDGEDLSEMIKMKEKLGEFARRNNSISRTDRDALVQQSTSAQAQAAASDIIRRDASSNSNKTLVDVSISKDSSTISPSNSLSESATPTADRSTTHSLETHPYIANGKLSPFPGLLAGNTPSPESSSVSLRMPSPLKQSKTVNGQHLIPEETDEDPSKAPTFFSNLRRKASNAASRVQRNNGDSPGSQSTKRFGSLLRRKPSEARRGLEDREMEISSPAPKVPFKQPISAAEVESAKPREDHLEIKEHKRVPKPTLLMPASKDILHRYSRILTSANESTSQLDIPGISREHIEDPPRKLLFTCPILQVVTASAVKDRFLFVFSDLLIVAKPVSPPEGNSSLSSSSLPTLQWTFSVKDIFEINQIKQLAMPSDERRHSTKGVPLMDEFIKLFQYNAEQAIDMVISKSKMPRSAPTIAQILHQTPELDRLQLSKYLFDPRSLSRKDVLKAFVELDKSAGVSIESALRSFLLEIRFPPSREIFEDLLVSFAIKWTANNRSMIKESFSEQLAVDLVFAIMALNDALHTADYTTPRMFSQSMPEWSKEEFLIAFRSKDVDMVLSDRTITRIYTSISQEPLQQAVLPSEACPRIAACIHSPGVPTRLTFGTYSNAIRISIPQIDPDFAIRLYGQDLAFTPQVLTFDRDRVQEFKVTSKSLGVKTIVFVRTGRNARFYPSSAKVNNEQDYSLPRSVNLVIERAFKQHCFTVAMSGFDGKKVTFSVDGEERREECIKMIKERMMALSNRESRTADRATEALALHVLRETIQEEATDGVSPLQRSASASAAPPSTRVTPRMKGLSRAPSDARALESSYNTGINRNESVSRHYYQTQGKNERDLLALVGEKAEVNGNADGNIKSMRGDDLVLTVRQNSLLSIVVAHLQQDQKK